MRRWEENELIIEVVTKKLDKGEPVDVIYLDFQKPFDKVSDRRLLNKVEVNYIRGKVLAWIEDYVTERRQRVGIRGSFHDGSQSLVAFHKGQYWDRCFSQYTSMIWKMELRVWLLNLRMIQKYVDGQVVLRRWRGCRMIGQAKRVGKEVADGIQCGKV